MRKKAIMIYLEEKQDYDNLKDFLELEGFDWKEVTTIE